ncbi:palmdelphin-like [Trematomus bernacchii]|uniref:palmdelphin-like n=1 Tax=Trematomus bernacchii TaxID=40690 RepID=UPI00146D5FD1|nr:palmdelphin-like [Trematomus bernacchii]
MEEAGLLKERLQAITDKRRIQENIAKKRREIEEEKLKLQYIKKKALREQWLMDGLSQQQEEQEAMRLQAEDEQQQSDQLQSNILRIEKEVEALETQELDISANEEAVLKRLKEVERTAEDIIKELNADFQADVMRNASSPLQDLPFFYPPIPTRSPAIHRPGSEEPKKATFAMEISVEHDKRTGKSQVVSTATITPESLQERGLKVYEDGRKSVYALHPDGGKMPSGLVGEMTPKEVEELLHQAADSNVPTGVQYHQPVYSAPYTESRPSTPRTPNQTPRETPTPTPRTPNQTPRETPTPFQSSAGNEAEILKEESQHSQDLEGWTTPKTPSPIQQDSRTGEETKLPFCHIPGQSLGDRPPISKPQFGAQTPRGLTNRKTDAGSPKTPSLVSVKARSEGMPTTVQPFYMDVDIRCPSVASGLLGDTDGFLESSSEFDRLSPFCSESIESLNFTNKLPEELESESVTMIFMGYENADEDEEDIQAELVVIGNSDDDSDEEAQCSPKERTEECLSYHPEGYKSQVFQPKMEKANVTGRRDIIDDAYSDWDDLGLHKPTFIHKSGKPSPYPLGHSGDTANTGSINMEEMKLCSTGR